MKKITAASVLLIISLFTLNTKAIDNFETQIGCLKYGQYGNACSIKDLEQADGLE